MAPKLTLRLPIMIHSNEIKPLYFTSADQPWLNRLLDELKRWENASPKQIQKNVNISHLNLPYKKGAFALNKVIEELTLKSKKNKQNKLIKHNLLLLASKVRNELLLVDPQKRTWNRSYFLKLVASQYLKQDVSEKDATQFIKSHFNDLTPNSVLKKIETLGNHNEIHLLLNQWLVKKVMSQSFMIEIIVKDQVRRLYRQAKFRGLICEIKKLNAPYLKFRISGPLSLFGPTRIYGKKFSEFLPLLFWNWEFKLRATIRELDQNYFLYLDSKSDIKIAQQPKLFDSKIELEFYHDFLSATKEWNLIREPEMININGNVLFPDFVVYKNNTTEITPLEGILIEIIGFWTKEYIDKKIAEISLYNGRKAIFIFSEKHRDKVHSMLSLESQNHGIFFYKRKILVESIIEKITELDNESL